MPLASDQLRGVTLSSNALFLCVLSQNQRLSVEQIIGEIYIFTNEATPREEARDRTHRPSAITVLWYAVAFRGMPWAMPRYRGGCCAMP